MLVPSSFSSTDQSLLNEIIKKNVLEDFLQKAITRELVIELYPNSKVSNKIYRAKDRSLRRFKSKIMQEEQFYNTLITKINIGLGNYVTVKNLEKKFGLKTSNSVKRKKNKKITDEDRHTLLYNYKSIVDNIIAKTESLKDSTSDNDLSKQLTVIKALEPAICLINTYLNQEDIKAEYTVVRELEQAKIEIEELELKIKELTNYNV